MRLQVDAAAALVGIGNGGSGVVNGGADIPAALWGWESQLDARRALRRVIGGQRETLEVLRGAAAVRCAEHAALAGSRSQPANACQPLL